MRKLENVQIKNWKMKKGSGTPFRFGNNHPAFQSTELLAPDA